MYSRNVKLFFFVSDFHVFLSLPLPLLQPNPHLMLNTQLTACRFDSCQFSTDDTRKTCCWIRIVVLRYTSRIMILQDCYSWLFSCLLFIAGCYFIVFWIDLSTSIIKLVSLYRNRSDLITQNIVVQYRVQTKSLDKFTNKSLWTNRIDLFSQTKGFTKKTIS